MPRLCLGVMLSAGLLLSACGADSDEQAGDSSAAGNNDCILLANGNKLCGQDAVAYCEGFFEDSPDYKSRLVCASIGADTTTSSGDPGVSPGVQKAEQDATTTSKQQGRKYRRAVRKVLGEDLANVRQTAPTAVRIETDYEYDDPVFAKPDKAKLRKACAAVQRIDPTVNVTAWSASDEFILRCAPK